MYTSSNSVTELKSCICLGGIAKRSPLERKSLSLNYKLKTDKNIITSFSGSWEEVATRSQVKLEERFSSFDKD